MKLSDQVNCPRPHAASSVRPAPSGILGAGRQPVGARHPILMALGLFLSVLILGALPGGQTALGSAPATVRNDIDGDGYADFLVSAALKDIGAAPNAGASWAFFGSATGVDLARTTMLYQGPALGETPEQGDFFGEEIDYGDFNGDGYTDVVLGVVLEDLNGISNAGALHVLYGTPSGLVAGLASLWHQDRAGIPTPMEQGDFFAEDLAVHDFNGDGYSDLAIGVPYEDLAGIRDAGLVHVLYGSAAGLTAQGNQPWHQGWPAVPDVPEPIDLYGEELATGDFNGDGYGDLIIGNTPESPLGAPSGGAATVLYGSATGLTAAGSRMWYQDLLGTGEGTEAGDIFGGEFAVGDFNNDRFDDLAIGVHREDLGLLQDTGAAHIIFGSPAGLSAEGTQFVDPTALGLPVDTAEARLSWALAAGDFNGDGYSDLAAGLPFTNPDGLYNAGVVALLFGSDGGLILDSEHAALPPRMLYQGLPGTAGAAEAQELFGWELGSDDYNGDGYADLVVGVVHQNVGAADSCGAVHVFYGSPTGPHLGSDVELHQDTPGVPGTCQISDNFGLL